MWVDRVRKKVKRAAQIISTKLPNRIWLLLVICCRFGQAFGQEKSAQVEGIVFDKDTRERVARTSIFNTRDGKLWYNNLKAEFKIDAQPGDKLIFNKEDYLPDTIIIKSGLNIMVYLQRTAIPLRGVTIKDSLHTPLQRLLATRKEFSKAYGSSAYNSPFSTIPGGGAGLNLDAIYNALSKSGRDAAHLQELIQQDYEQNVIDYRFNKSFVASVTKLKEPDLTSFMLKYRPSYYRVNSDTEYEFITYIRTSLKRYLRNKRANSVQPLKPPQS